MKFPLQERPFELLKFSPERVETLDRLARELVEASLIEFRDFIAVHNRVLPTRQFRPVKTFDKVTIYKESSERRERVFGPLGSKPAPNANAALLLPKLVAVGTMRGRMEDLLLGTAVRDATAIMVKTSYMEDDVVDCGVHEIRGAKSKDPFRHLAVQWLVKGLKSPRDMLLVHSSGLIVNEGIGYHLLHSIDEIVPEFMSLENKYGIRRERFSTMFMFRQLTPDSIECYTTNYVQPNGSSLEAVAITTTATSMGSISKSIDCAQNMKLSWILQNKEAYMGRPDPSQTMNTGDKCELCHKKPTLTGRLTDCSLCDARVCSRCRVTKKLSRANRRLEVKVDKHEFCKTCLYRALNEDAVRVAAEMNVGARITPWFQMKDPNNRMFSYAGSSVSDGRGSQSSDSSHGTRSSRTGARSYQSLGKSRSDTVSTVSTSGLQSDRSRDPVDSFSFSHLIDKDLRAPSIAESMMTDLSFEGMEFHDDDDDESVILEPLEDDDEWERQQYQAFLAQQHAQRKFELEQQYHEQLRQLKESKQEQQQMTTYRTTRASSTGSRRATYPRLPSRDDIDEMKSPGPPPSDHVAQVYSRMQSLQLAANETFELTRDNERNLNQRTQRQWTK